MTENDRILQSLFLLYGAGIPQDVKTAVDGLQWFLCCGKEPEKTSKSSEDAFDFDEDHYRILSAFRTRYGIDLKTANMHWFEFISLFGDLGECGLTTIMEYRTKDLSALKGKERQMYTKLKKRYALRKKLVTSNSDELDELVRKLNSKE